MKRNKFLKSGLMALTLASVLTFVGCGKSDKDPVYASIWRVSILWVKEPTCSQPIYKDDI